MASSSNSCNQLLTANFISSCAGLTKIGGVDGTVYIGFRSDIATLALTAGAITTFTLASGKKLAKFSGKKEQHEITWESIPMKGSNAMYKHMAKLYLYPETQADVANLELLISSKRMFLIYVNLQGKVKALGIDINPYIGGDFDDERGLSVLPSTYTEGATVAADSWCELSMEGTFWSAPKFYKPAVTLATTITELDGLSFTA
jgi:hypothetical protein